MCVCMYIYIDIGIYMHIYQVNRCINGFYIIQFIYEVILEKI